MDIAKGERYADRFTVLEKIRTGGTADLFKAYDDELGTVVALKIFTIEGRDPDVVNEFWHREISALSALKHDAVVKLLSAGRHPSSGQRYAVLEWIDGITLEDHLSKAGAMPWERFYDAFG